jgi:transposase
MPDCTFRPVDQTQKFGCPRRLPPFQALTGNLPIKKNPQPSPLKKQPGRNGLAAAAAAEIYLAPRPPAKGRIIGVDCHPDTFTAAVFTGSSAHDAQKHGCREKLSLEALLKWAAKEFTREDLFLMEAGSNSFEVYRRLLQLGLRAVVLESGHVGRHAKIYADNDKMAAARIALVYLGTKAPCVWVPDAITCERRELLHCHQSAVADHTAMINAIKGYLNQYAIRLGKRALQARGTKPWVFKQRPWSRLQREVLSDYFEQFEQRAQRVKHLERLIAEQIAAEPLMLRCMKLLGIGKINAFAILAIVGDVRRFERPQKLVAYLGLNPGQRDSGDGKRIKLGVGKRGRGDLRHLLIQGAQAVLRMGSRSQIGKWGWKLFARKGQRNIAVVGVARKMVVQVWHLLMGNPPTGLDKDKSLRLKQQKVAATLGAKLRVELGLPSKLVECVKRLLARIEESPLAATPPPEPT